MLRVTKLIAVVGFSLASATSMADIVFQQDFQSGLGSNERVFSQNWVYHNGCWNLQNTNNWGVHDGTQNPWVSGGSPYPNGDMQGNVLGHITANYDKYERSYYEIDLDLTGFSNSELSFDFDSWIQDDGSDGFNVIAYNGSGGRSDATDTTGFNLLTPTLSSEMQYVALPGNANGGQLDNISDFSEGFNGHDSTMNMEGHAMFNLAAYDDQVITLRFSFGSNNNTQAEGINIDNILITGDTPPSTGVPEPAGLSLLGLGLLGMLGRRKLKKS